MDIIAIDCGASFIKATRFINGKIFRSIRQKTPLDTDADKLEKSLSMIKAMIEELSNDVSEIAIGFSMNDFIFLYIRGPAANCFNRDALKIRSLIYIT